MAGVQYQNPVEARSDAQFHSSSKGGGGGGHNRAPDLVLRPTKEGMDFTIRLIQANRMSKVVEIRFDSIHSGEDDHDDGNDEEKKTANSPNSPSSSSSNNKHEEVTDEDVKKLFQAIGGSTGEEEEEDDSEDVTDDYQPTNSQLYTGLPHLESLVIIVRGEDEAQEGSEEATTTTTTRPSFIKYLTSFLAASTRFPRFTRLALEGVNLRGDILELRGFAEAFRLHPHINHVQLISCHFTPEQQTNMNLLEDVFNDSSNRQQQYPGEPTNSASTSSTLDAQRANIRHMKQLIMQHQHSPPTSPTPTTSTEDKKQSTSAETAKAEATNEEGGSWLERFLKSCFCWL